MFNKHFHSSIVYVIVTESRLVLLAVPQANKSREELLSQRIETSFEKTADQEDGGQMLQITILESKNHLKIHASFILKGEVVWLVVANFLEQKSFVL